MPTTTGTTTGTEHWLTLPCYPHSIIVPDLPSPPPPPFARPPHCGATGRLLLRPATTHLYRANFCRRWSCPVCCLARTHTLLSTLAVLFLPHDHIHLGFASPDVIRARIARLSYIPGRATVSFTDRTTFTIANAPLGAGFTPHPPELALTLIARQLLSPPPSPTRVRFSGTWEDIPPDNPSLILLRDVDPRIAGLVFGVAVDRAAELFQVPAWGMSDPVPGSVSIRWWVETLHELARDFGTE